MHALHETCNMCVFGAHIRTRAHSLVGYMRGADGDAMDHSPMLQANFPQKRAKFRVQILEGGHC
jgi:hypothetical protein